MIGRYMVPWINPLNEKEKLEWDNIEVKSKSGGNIVGLFSKTERPAKGTIVLGHPVGKEAKAYFLKNKYPEFLKRHGYNVLIFDLNGFGESTIGNFEVYEDVIAISIKAKELTPNLPIGYHGISLGGLYGISSFANKRHYFDFAIIESAPTTFEEFWKDAPVPLLALKVLGYLMPTYSKKTKAILQIENINRVNSILFIYATSDKYTPLSMGKRFLQQSPVDSELWTVEDAKHAKIISSNHAQEYKSKIISFLDKSVKKTNTAASEVRKG